MRTSNNNAENLRQAETGLVWQEQLTNAMGTLNLQEAQTFRVRATGATTVTISGVLAMTMSSGEIAIFNAGKPVTVAAGTAPGAVTSTPPPVVVVIAGANAFVQVAKI
jgi:hypothetical protein